MSLNKSPITTHVLDTAKGRPAFGIKVQLQRQSATGDWRTIGSGQTDTDGRATQLTHEPLQVARYRIAFATAEYFAVQGVECFYPAVSIEFHVAYVDQHYHVPLLLSPFGYSTYRGS
jgi:5-hydroxyisourate hydrolase